MNLDNVRIATQLKLGFGVLALLIATMAGLSLVKIDAQGQLVQQQKLETNAHHMLARYSGTPMVVMSLPPRL